MSRKGAGRNTEAISVIGRGKGRKKGSEAELVISLLARVIGSVCKIKSVLQFCYTLYGSSGLRVGYS